MKTEVRGELEKFSFTKYKNIYSKDGITINLFDYINEIKSKENKFLIEKIRNQKNPDKRNELKKSLNIYTLSCICENERKSSNVTEHSGLLQVDIDDEMLNLNKLKDLLKNYPYIFILHDSPSKKIKAIVKIKKTKDINQHKLIAEEVYKKIEKDLGLGKVIDRSPKDIARACYSSYDKDVFINLNSKIFQVNIIKEQKKKKSNLDYKKIVKGLNQGNRNNQLFKLGCSLKANKVDEEIIYKQLSLINKENNPPLPESEIKTILKSVMSYKDNIKPFEMFINNYQNNVLNFYKMRPFFYDKSKIFWFWNNNLLKYEIVDEIDLMVDLDKALEFNGRTVGAKNKASYIESFKRVGRMNHPKEVPKSWIQFKDKIYDINKGFKEISTDYFFTNPIPYDIGQSSETPTMDKLFESWVGKKYIKTLYEIIAYCCYRGYPIQLLFSLCGSGRNGKSQYLKIIDKFLGHHNCVSTELSLLLENRFETFKLYKKLVCIIGETEFGILNKSSILKKLTGGDKIGFEKKNKDPFDDYNYAKPLIASNSLPSSRDTSDGFYRRWLIINFPNEFKESGHDIIDTIPEEEYNNLAKKVTILLPELLKRGKFTNQGTIKERKEKYIEMSNPLSLFIDSYCIKNFEYYESYTKLYTKYVNYLLKNKKRKVGYNEFRSALEDEGMTIEKTTREGVSARYILGLKLKDELKVKEENIIENKEKEVIRFVNCVSNDYNKAELFFGDDIIKKCLSKGILFEQPKGILKELT